MTVDEGRRERLRFDSFRMDTFPDGFCRAAVTVEWQDGVSFTAEVRGTQTLQGRLRAGADAVLGAAAQATGGSLDLELRGVKAVRAFDAWVVMVCLQGRSPERAYRLIGAYACPDDDTARGAALATLDATNRVLQRYVADGD